MEEYYIIEYLNCKKNFQKDSLQFKGPHAYEEAIAWGRENLENFNLDVIRIIYLKQYASNSDIYKYKNGI